MQAMAPDQVRALQRALNHAGFPVGGVDGKPGPRTQQALTNYIRENRLPPDTPIAKCLQDLQQKAATVPLPKSTPKLPQDKAKAAAEKTLTACEKAQKKFRDSPTSATTRCPAAKRAMQEKKSENLKVAAGQITFDAEGNDNPNSPFYSRHVHWPGGVSGVTIGRGYDMGSRTEAQVKADMISAGMDEETAAKYAKGARKTGADAQKWTKDNQATLAEMSHEVQQQLFQKVTYPKYVQKAKDEYEDRRGDMDPEWDTLDAKVRDIAVDLKYQQGSFYKSQLAAIAKNDRKKLADAVIDDCRTAKYEAGRNRAAYLRPEEPPQ